MVIFRNYFERLMRHLRWSLSLEDCSLNNILWHFRKLLIAYGIRISDDSTHQVEVIVFSTVLTIVIYAVNMSGCFYNYLISEETEKINSGSLFIGSFQCYIRSIWFFIYRKELTELLCAALYQNLSLSQVEEVALHEEMKRAKWRCRSYAIIVITNVVCFVLIGPIINGGLPLFLITVPGLGDIHKTPNFQITYAVRSIVPIYLIVMVVTFDILFIVLTGHLAGHIRALSAEVKDFAAWAAQSHCANTHTRLTYIAKRHQEVKVMIIKLRDMLTDVIGIHAFSVAMCALFTFQNPSILTASTLLHLVLTMLLYCFFGEYLMTTGTELEEALYDSNWQLLADKDARTVLIMLRNAQVPLVLTVFKVFNLTLSTYMGFIKSLYSVALAVLGISEVI